MTTLLPYQDPLIALVKDPELNKSKEKANELLSIINNFQSKESTRIKKKCILGFQVLRDLERLELRTKNWEFLSLDFSIESILNEDRISETKSKFNKEIARKVLSNCVEMHALINEINNEIDDINDFINTMNTFEYISDPGTILTQLTLRIINLKNRLTDNLTILYSKLKLITIGIDLERLLENCDFEKFNETTIESYREFINQLLKQLNDAIKLNDSIEILECIEIVNDVEQMFESISLENKYLKDTAEPELTRQADSYGEQFDISIESSSDEDNKKLFERRRRLSLSSVSTSTSMLHKTTLQDELPHLMSAFDTAKNVEEEIREFRTPKNRTSDEESSPSTIDIMSSSNSPSSSNKQNKKPVFFGPSLPPSMSHSQQALPQQENFIPKLSNSYIFDNNSSFLNKIGIKPQVIHLDSNNNRTSSSSPLSSPPITSSTQRYLQPATHIYSTNKNNINENNNNNNASTLIGINSVWNLKKKNSLTETNLKKLDSID